MPFPWHHPSVVERPQRREEICRQELADRAALLSRLGYKKKETRARLADNIEWDYEVGHFKPPLSAKEIDAIVDAVYKRGNASGDLSSAL